MAQTVPPRATVAQEVAALDASLQGKLGPALRAFLVDRDQNAASTSSLGLDGLARESGAAAPSAYVLIEGDASDRDLEALGIQVMTRTPFSCTALVPLTSIAGLLVLPAVQGVDSPHAVDKHLNVSAPDIDAPYVWGKSSSNPPTYSGYSGKNVIVGVIDTGLDLTHGDFKTSLAKTRVKYLWDQNGVGAPPPTGYNYGAEWAGTTLDLNLAVSTDNDGHGTHITGIAAGNGSATGAGFPAYRYIGIAPEANLIIVKSIMTDQSIIDGAKYIFGKATSMNEDAVVLIASGNERGAHDGGAALDMSLSALTGPGHLIVASVGNYGQLAIHSRLNVASNGATGTVTPVIPTYSPSNQEVLDVQSWHLSTALFQARVTTPTGIVGAWIQPNATSGTITTNDGTYSLSNDQTTNAKGRKLVELYIWSVGGTSPRPKSGTWKVDFQRLSGSTTGVVDSWISDWRFGSGGVSPTFSTNVDMTTTLASPASGDSIIGVTAYTTRNTWPNFLGQTSFYSDNPALQGFYEPSALGPRLDGVQRPDVAAPGEGIVSALAVAIAGTAGNLKVDDTVHWILRGTSQSAAHIAGALADLLQQTPHMSPSAARAMLHTKVRGDSNTGSLPNSTWGWGKFDFKPVLVGVGDGPKGLFGLSPAWPNPARGTVYFAYELSSSDVALAADGGVRLEIFDARGRLMASIPGSVEAGAQRVSWNGLSEHGYPAPAGLYLARLEVGNQSAITKFVRIAP